MSTTTARRICGPFSGAPNKILDDTMTRAVLVDKSSGLAEPDFYLPPPLGPFFVLNLVWSPGGAPKIPRAVADTGRLLRPSRLITPTISRVLPVYNLNVVHSTLLPLLHRGADRHEATRGLSRVWGICSQGLGRSLKSFIFGVYTGPIGFQTRPKRWRASPSNFVKGVWRPIGPV